MVIGRDRGYTLRFDIMPFLDQKWLRLGANFFIKDFLLAETRDKWVQTRNKYKKIVGVIDTLSV